MSMALLASSAFSDLDRHFARFIERLDGGAQAEVALAAALVSRSRGAGDICLDLRALAGTLFPPMAADGPRVQLPELEHWLETLRGSAVAGPPEQLKPLVVDAQGRLYLRRYWEYEASLARAILTRAVAPPVALDDALLREGLERCFPGATTETDGQRVAAETALQRNFCVITGGPGTGKTRTVVVLLALMLEQAGPTDLRIALTAPTGKAAARLQESIQRLKPLLNCAESVRARLPEDAATVHRLLGSRPDSASFRHHAENPLPFDVVVVDEASMVDLALMAKLFAAIPPTARVILLGDKDQLASVEAGAVLGDICHGEAAAEGGFAQPQQLLLLAGDSPHPGRRSEGESSALSGCVVALRKNYRFGSDHRIHALSRAVNAGDAARSLDLLRGTGTGEEIMGRALPAPKDLSECLRELVLNGFGEVMRTRDPLTALAALNRFRILCAVRHGPYGVEQLNQRVEAILGDAGLIVPRERWYPGRPVLVKQNDYNLKLFNGDVGIVLPDAESGTPLAWFLDADGRPRSVLALRLPEHETVFAMTVHKSQGSEFDNVLLVLPDRESPVLTRELLYTGLTRASRRVEVWFHEPVWRAAVARRVERASGLRDALWGAGTTGSP